MKKTKWGSPQVTNKLGAKKLKDFKFLISGFSSTDKDGTLNDLMMLTSPDQIGGSEVLGKHYVVTRSKAKIVFSDNTIIDVFFYKKGWCSFDIVFAGDLFIKMEVICDGKNEGNMYRPIMDKGVEWAVIFCEEQNSSLEDYKNTIEVACEIKTDNTHPCKGGFPKKSSIPIISSGWPNWFNGFSKSFKKK